MRGTSAVSGFLPVRSAASVDARDRRDAVLGTLDERRCDRAVVYEDDRIIGTIARPVLLAAAPDADAAGLAEQPTYIAAGADVTEASRLMQYHQVRTLLVVQGNTWLGVVVADDTDRGPGTPT